MRYLEAVTLAALLAGVHTMTEAQTPGRPPAGPGPQNGGEVRGTVVEAGNNAGIGSASVAVRLHSDSSLVTGAIVQDDGNFRIIGLRPGTYHLRVTAIGFTPLVTDPFTVSPEQPRANAGSIALSRFAVTLQEIEVTADRPTVVIEPDRNSYRARDIAPAASSASDILQSTPSVEVDADGKVSLRGNENVVVQINGRPAPLRGAQLGGYLRQLPASVIDRIEVIPNPSARQDPEGMAGIINVVMKENTDLGLSGGFTAFASPSNRYNASGNLGYQSGPVTLFTTYGYNADERNVFGINDRERFDALRQPLSYTEQDVDGEVTFGGHNFTSSIDYKLNGRDNIYSAFMLNRRSNTDNSLTNFLELDGNRALRDQYDRLRDSEARGMVLDYTLAFKRVIQPRRQEFGAEVRINRASDDDRTALWRQPPQDSESHYEIEAQSTDALTYQLTAQADYTHPLAERTKLETGFKSIARWLDRDYVIMKDVDGTGDWVRGDLSNSFDFDDQVHAAYGQLSHGVGKWELQAGLRAEYARRDFALAEPAERFPYSYSSLYPSGIASYKLSDATNVKLSYSRRVRRPGTQELNPFPQFFDAQNVFIGNPRLNPEYTDAFELGISRTGRLGMVQLSPFYRRTTDVIRFIIDTDAIVDGREVTSVTFENLATGNSWGTDLNGQLRLGPKFTGLGGFQVYKMVTEGGSETSLASNAVFWTARVNLTSQITKSTTLQGFYFYRSPQNVERARFSKAQMASFTVRQRLDDRKALTFRYVDPFNTMGFRVEAGDDNIWQITERKFGVRSVHLGFQYTYGQAPRIRQPRPDQVQEPQVGFPQ